MSWCLVAWYLLDHQAPDYAHHVFSQNLSAISISKLIRLIEFSPLDVKVIGRELIMTNPTYKEEVCLPQ